MDKDNQFRSCSFHMDDGDEVHILVKDFVGDRLSIELSDIDGNYEDGNVVYTSFVYYYIDANIGDDITGDGSNIHPWRTLYKACSSVTEEGSVIHVNAGDYIETEQCFLSPGVGIEGEGDTSHIIVHFVTPEATDYSNSEMAFLMLQSGLISNAGSSVVDGDQTISHLKFDGDNIASIAMLAWCRNNVIVENCTFIDFLAMGVTFKTNRFWTEPLVYAIGVIVRNCVFTDCSERMRYLGQGAIWAGGQEGMLVYNNTFTLNGKPLNVERNGNIMFASFIKGFKYYNNTSTKSLEGGENMGIEVWDTRGGNEIYDNIFIGNGTHVDIAGISNTAGTYAYSWWVHDNTFMMISQIAAVGTSYAVVFESSNEYAIVERNYLKNLGKCFAVTIYIWMTPEYGGYVNDIRFRYNVCENIGYTDEPWTDFMYIATALSHHIIENIYIENNTYSGGTHEINEVIQLHNYNIIRNIYITNNIFKYIDRGVYFWLELRRFDPTHEPTYDYIYIRNNLIYNDTGRYGIYSWPPMTVPNLIQENYIYSDPLFFDTDDLRISQNSPANNSGINLGLFNDYLGNSVGIIPDRGGYEYWPDGIITNLAVVAISKSQINLTWDNNGSGETSVRVERSQNLSSGFVEIASLPSGSNSYSHINLLAYSRHYYRVRTVTAGISSYYCDVEFTTTLHAPIIHAEQIAYIAGLVTPLSVLQEALINDFIDNIKVGLGIVNLTDVFDTLWLLAGETQESSLRNMAKNDHHCTIAGTVGFTALEGYLGDGSTGLIRTDYNPFTDGVNFIQNSASMGGYVRNDVIVEYLMGVINQVTQDKCYLSGRLSALNNQVWAAINTNSYGKITDLVINGSGIFIGSRTDANTIIGFYNGIQTEITNTDPSVVIINIEHVLLGIWHPGFVAHYSTVQLAFAFHSRELSAPEGLALTNVIENYMDINWKGVI